VGDRLGQLGDGLVQAGVSGQCHDLDTADRIATQGEVVVMQAHALQSRYLAPDARQRLLGGGAGREKILLIQNGEDRLGQGLPVDFAIGRAGQPAQQNQAGGQHPGLQAGVQRVVGVVLPDVRGGRENGERRASYEPSA
jgi:hypothetical protein